MNASRLKECSLVLVVAHRCERGHLGDNLRLVGGENRRKASPPEVSNDSETATFNESTIERRKELHWNNMMMTRSLTVALDACMYYMYYDQSMKGSVEN